MRKFTLSMALFLFAATGAHSAETAALEVAANEFDRQDSPTYFNVPATMGEGPFRLRDEKGAALPVQMDSTRRACFILPELKAGQLKKFVLEKHSDKPADSVTAVRKGGAIEISIGGKPVLDYQSEKTALPAGYGAAIQRGGYIFPVYTPGGKLVVDDYPPGHKHHHGIWAPWTKTAFEGRSPDFWNMGKQKDGSSTGEVVPAGEAGFSGGPVFATLKASHRFVDLSAAPPKAALNETWELTVYTLGAADSKHRLFDLVSTQTCASDSPLSLPMYYYGGLGVRGNRQWDGKANTFFLTSEGKDRDNGNETSGRWGHMGGKVDGELAGIAILSHPSNFRFPQPMRLHPTEPFFNFAPSQGGDWEIAPGKPYVARYRFIVADGAPDAKLLERLWIDYARPPAVSVK